MLRSHPGRWLPVLLLSGAGMLCAQMPATRPTSNTLPTAVPASALTPAQQATHRADVTYIQGRLEIIASNSSLNQILRQVSRQTGLLVTGGVEEERVFGKYGPGAPADVLTSLLDGTAANVLYKAGDDSGPAELSLTPRRGGPTPPSPGSFGPDDAAPAQASAPPPSSAPASATSAPPASHAHHHHQLHPHRRRPDRQLLHRTPARPPAPPPRRPAPATRSPRSRPTGSRRRSRSLSSSRRSGSNNSSRQHRSKPARCNLLRFPAIHVIFAQDSARLWAILRVMSRTLCLRAHTNRSYAYEWESTDQPGAAAK